jgi:hypothetical protein
LDEHKTIQQALVVLKPKEPVEPDAK